MVCVCKYMMSYIIISIANVASGFVEDHCQPVELKPHYLSISCLYPSSYPRTQSLFPFQAEVGMEIVTACTTYSLHSYCEVWEWPCVLSLPPWTSLPSLTTAAISHQLLWGWACSRADYSTEKGGEPFGGNWAVLAWEGAYTVHCVDGCGCLNLCMFSHGWYQMCPCRV